MARTRKHKCLADKVLNEQSRYAVRFDSASGKYAIYDNANDCFIGDDRWATRKSAKDFLAVGLMLGRII